MEDGRSTTVGKLDFHIHSWSQVDLSCLSLLNGLGTGFCERCVGWKIARVSRFGVFDVCLCWNELTKSVSPPASSL